MPQGGNRKKEDAVLKELREIKFLLRHLLEEEKKDNPSSKWKRALSQLGLGIVRGLGAIIGATVVAGLLFFLLRAVLEKIDVQDLLSEQIEMLITKQLEESRF